jgi:hypothetical protein
MERFCLVFLFSLCGKSFFAGETFPLPDRKNFFASNSSFLENKGQMRTMDGDPAHFVLFKAESGGTDTYITTKGLTYVLFHAKEEKDPPASGEYSSGETGERFVMRWQKVTMELEGASLRPDNVIREMPGQGVENYYAAGSAEAVTNVRSYGKLTFRDVYPGIDWVLFSDGSNGLKYDFYVHEGADASQIKWKCSSPSRPCLEEGAFTVKTRFGTLRENAPVSYLLSGKPVKSGFLISDLQRAGDYWEFRLKVTADQQSVPLGDILVIDPQVTWSTLYGGNSVDGVKVIDTDHSGNLFACGYSYSTNFPLQNAGTFYSNSGVTFLMKFSNAGALLWSTFFGNGGGSTEAESLICDPAGNVFVSGTTSGGSVPLLNAGSYYQGFTSGANDAYISKFNNNGLLLWSTLYGGNSHDAANDIASDANGNIFVCGVTSSTNFPVQNGGGFFQGTLQLSNYSPGFLLKFDNAGNRIWATLLNGLRPYSISTDPAGNIFLASTGLGTTSTTSLPLMNPGGGAYYQGNPAGGADLIISRFSGSGQLNWGTYYGGSAHELPVFGVVTDHSGNVFVSGTSTSTNFPVMNAGTFFQSSLSGGGYGDPFIIKFSNSGVRQWATYFGGSGYEGSGSFDNLASDACGNIYLSFETATNSIGTQGACDGGYLKGSGLGSMDGFLARFHNNGALDWATYFGGSGVEYRLPLAVDPYGNLFVSGEWQNPQSSVFNALTYPLVNLNGSYHDASHNGDHDSFFLKFGSGAPSAFFYPVVCVGTTPTVLPSFMQSFLTGGTFSNSAGLSINPADGQINVAGSVPGIYTVTYTPPGLTATCGCTYTVPTTATVNLSQVTVTVPSAQVCAGNSATLTSNVISSSPFTYSWSPSGPATSSWVITPGSTSPYSVTVTNAEGCIAGSSIVVAVNPLPTVSVAGNTIGCAGTTFSFQAAGAWVYQWSIGVNGPSSATIAPAGNINFTVKGITMFGCAHTVSVHVIALYCTSVREQDADNTTLSVYPNPGSSEFTIEGGADMLIRVENDLGQLVRQVELNAGNERKCSLSGLAAGIYFIHGYTGREVYSRKIIIERR